MKLTGKIVKQGEEKYTNKTTGLEIQLYRVYLESGDPLSGALEVSVTDEQYKTLIVGQEIAFVPSFSTRTWNRNLIVTAKVLEGLEISSGTLV